MCSLTDIQAKFTIICQQHSNIGKPQARKISPKSLMIMDPEAVGHKVGRTQAIEYRVRQKSMHFK